MGSFNKRLSFFLIFIIYFSLFFLFNTQLHAQESDNIYVETLTISVDSQELINLEQEISEIPLFYDIINLSENFITSYEQLSLNVIQFKYDLNYYFLYFLYSSLYGYRTIFYYSSSYGVTYFQGYNIIEVYSYLPFSGYHLFQNNFEFEKKIVNWSLNYIYRIKIFNLPEAGQFSYFSSIFTEQNLKGEKNNFNFEIFLKSLSFIPYYSTFFLEEAILNYYVNLGNNLSTNFRLIQSFSNSINLKPEVIIDYDFNIVKLLLGFSYEIFFNSFYGFLQFNYNNENIRIFIIIKKDYQYDFIQDIYTIYSDGNYLFYEDFISFTFLFYYTNNNFKIKVDSDFSWFLKKPIKVYDDQLNIFKLTEYYNLWNLISKIHLNWKINNILETEIDLKLNLPSYLFTTKLFLEQTSETFLSLDLIFSFLLDEISKLSFSLYSEIMRNFLGFNNPIYNFQIEYNIKKNDFDIMLLLKLNIIRYYILPEIQSPVINLTFSFQFYF